MATVAACGMALAMAACDGSGAASGPAFPASSPVPAPTYELQRVETGRATGWILPEALLGPRDVAVDSEGVVWVSEQNRGVVDTFADGRLTRFRTDAFPDGGAFALAPGPDGAMWFSGYPAGSLGRVMPDGSANLFDAVGDGATTLGIAAGPDHTMWATDPVRGLVLRIGADSTVDLVSVAPGDGSAAEPHDIVQGPDGAMWFTDPATGSVGRIATDGSSEINRYQVGPSDGHPRSIAVAPDGSLWVTLSHARSVARIDPSDGSSTVVLVQGAGAELNDLAVASDGSLWITQAGPDVIHVTPEGSLLDRVRLPGGAVYADGIGIGPDGTVWAAASDANLLVSIR